MSDITFSGSAGRPNRNMREGDEAVTDYEGRLTRVVIIDRKEGCRSQSGIMYRVRPALRNTTERDWIDADWFQPVIATEKEEGSDWI